MRLLVDHQYWQFWPILARFMDYYSLFWGPRVFSTIKNPGMRLRVGHQHWLFWPILACFMDYCSLFWGPIVITTINKPWDAITCRSSTLAVLADSGPFHELLLTVLGSRTYYHD